MNTRGIIITPFPDETPVLNLELSVYLSYATIYYFYVRYKV